MTDVPVAAPFVSAVVLAAGGSTRMGRPKLALPVRGTPMIRLVVQAARASRCREVIVVLGTHAEIYQPLLDGLDAQIVINVDPAEGLGSSIRRGVEAVATDAQGVVILLADQPFVTADVIDRLIETAVTEGRRIVASAYHRTAGVPAYFQRALFLELLTLEGDQGARSVIERYPKEGVAVPLPEAVATDVDTAEDFSTIEGV